MSRITAHSFPFEFAYKLPCQKRDEASVFAEAFALEESNITRNSVSFPFNNLGCCLQGHKALAF